MNPTPTLLRRICAALVVLSWHASTPADEAIFVLDAETLSLTNLADSDGFRPLLAAPEEDGKLAATPPADLAARLMARSRPFQRWLDEASAATGVDRRLLQAVAAVESGFNPKARSGKGAVGLMQLIPETARRYGVADLLDPRQNIFGGARYLADLLRMFDNDASIALAAYNAGAQAVIRHGRRIPPYAETIDYVPRVLGYAKAIRLESGGPQ